MINDFEGKHRFLSNFYPCWITFEGSLYPSVEHAYQAAKTLDRQLRLPFQEEVVTAAQAKKMGRRVKSRSDWADVKLSVMNSCLREKFRQPKFKSLLLATGDQELIEGNWWGDVFWGVCNGVGENHLGKLLMKIREELRNENSIKEE